MQFHVNTDNELVLTTKEGPRLTVLSYDEVSDYYSIEILDVMFEVLFEDGSVGNTRADDPDYACDAATIAEDYIDLIHAGCMKFKELVVKG